MSTAIAERMIEHPSEHLVQNLATTVEGAIWAFDPIRQSNAILRVTADGGVVTLSGNMRSDIMKGVAARLARTVPGVRDVRNGLVTDTAIESQAALAMALEPGLEVLTDRMSVMSLLGVVDLGGAIVAPSRADAEAKRERVVALVGALPGVRAVLNNLQAVEGTGESAGAVEEDGAAAAPAGQAEIQARLEVWRERAKAAGKL